MAAGDGINRNMDELGRIVIPIEWRKQLKIDPGEELSIRKDGRKLIITKAAPTTCDTCGGKA